MDDLYFLQTKEARQLYQEVKALPIVDYHNHLNVSDLANKRQYHNIAEAWLKEDPYKHRAMRILGVEERLITGDASDFEKFSVWCSCFPLLVGNPLYDWSRIEMEKIFSINKSISGENAKAIWDEANEKLADPSFSARGIFDRFPMEYASPCVALMDDLKPFTLMQHLAPSLRGDSLMAPNRTFLDVIEMKGGTTIKTLEEYLQFIDHRLDAFQQVGCRFSDHALDAGFQYQKDDGLNNKRFEKVLKGEQLDPKDRDALSSFILCGVAGMYAKRKWTMQLHIGARRTTSTRLRTLLGPAGGYACMGQGADMVALTNMLDAIEQGPGGLPKVILYTLNPIDHAAFSVMSGSYSQDGVAAKVTEGPAWWWCDHAQGMHALFDIFSSYSVLSTFVGMTTDSRSLFSLSRHDYFRHAFCGWLGEQIQKGTMPSDLDLLSDVAKRVCYGNAHRLLEGK